MTLDRLYMGTFLRFLFVGGCVAVLYAVLAALATTHLPLPKPVSAAGIYILHIPLGFWCQRHFTFASSTPRRHALWLYAATQVLGICIAAAFSHLFARGVFWQDVFVHLGASALAAIVSYLINRLVIFPDTGRSGKG